MIPAAEIAKDIDLILWSAQLKEVYRYQKQKFWETETAQHEQAMQAYPAELVHDRHPTSESDAAHSWHMADMAMILAPRFPELDLGKCVMLAVIHDKLEIITGDADPLGKNGDGKDTHAFNEDSRAIKKAREKEALSLYSTKLSDTIRPMQESLFLEEMTLQTPESRFIKALDRLQPLTYILQRKNGKMHDHHIDFTIRHTGQCKDYFPSLTPYHDELMRRILDAVAKKRQTDTISLKQQFGYAA